MVMKICIVSEREYGCGASIAACRLARALAEDEHEVHYVFKEPHEGVEPQNVYKWPLGQRQSIWSHVAHKLLALGSEKTRFRYHCHKNYQELLSLAERTKPDVINLHNIGTILTHEAVVSLGYKYPIAWTMHDFFAVKPYCYQFVNGSGRVTETVVISPEFVSRGAQKRLISSPSRVRFVAPSRWLHDSIRGEVAGNKQVFTIPNGLSNQEFFHEDQAKARELLGLSKEGFYLLFVASTLEYERKNIRVLSEAIELIRNPEIEVLALGNTSSEFRNQYAFIRFFDADFDPKKLRTLYSAADIFVIPSLVDNLPNTVLESLFCGTAVVGADVGGIPEMVVPGETGWLFDPRDPRSLAEILSQIYQERELLSRMKVRCRSWVQDRFSIENQRDQYLQLFQAIVDDNLEN